MLWEDCEDVVKGAWNADGNGVHGLAMIKEKIDACGEVLKAWGSSKTNLNTEEIKELQKQLEKLNIEESTEQSS